MQLALKHPVVDHLVRVRVRVRVRGRVRVRVHHYSGVRNQQNSTSPSTFSSSVSRCRGCSSLVRDRMRVRLRMRVGLRLGLALG